MHQHNNDTDDISTWLKHSWVFLPVWCQQLTSMCFQALRSYTKEFREELGKGGGGFSVLISFAAICGIQFYIHQDLVYHVSGGTECIWKYGPPGGAEDNGPGI